MKISVQKYWAHQISPVTPWGFPNTYSYGMSHACSRTIRGNPGPWFQRRDTDYKRRHHEQARAVFSSVVWCPPQSCVPSSSGGNERTSVYGLSPSTKTDRLIKFHRLRHQTGRQPWRARALSCATNKSNYFFFPTIAMKSILLRTSCFLSYPCTHPVCDRYQMRTPI